MGAAENNQAYKILLAGNQAIPTKENQSECQLTVPQRKPRKRQEKEKAWDGKQKNIPG